MKNSKKNAYFGFSRIAACVGLLLLIVCAAAYAQTSSTQPTRQLTPEEQKEVQQAPPDQRKKMESYFKNMTPAQRKREGWFDDMRKLYSIKDPDQRMTAMAQFVKSHEEFMKEGTDGPANMAFDSRDYIKANRANSAKLREKISAIDNAFAPSAALGKSLFESMVARSLLKNGAALNYAASLAQSSIDLFHHDEYVASQRSEHKEREEYASKNEKPYVPESFNPGDADVHFRQEVSARYATLGSIQQKLGQNDAALQSFRSSLKFHADMEAYLGVAKLEETRGDKAAALNSLYDADLTGHLAKDDILHMRQLYVEVHPGSSEKSLEALLDAKYQATFHNPVQFSLYSANATRSDRAVLAEFFTGAGCEPCMSPDLAFDASLQRYTRSELVLLVYHDNAPDADPLANNVTEERAKYYSTGGSTPHAFLDGKEIGLVQGLPSHAQDAFDAISKSIDKLLDVPAGAHMEIKTKRHGMKVIVQVQGAITKAAVPLELHIDLVETEVSYSGENGLRFQPMVVRATAKQTKTGSGFDVSDHTKFKAKYTFDLTKIEADNLTYYAQFDAEVKKRTHGMFGAQVREYKNVIDPNKLAAVAFVQNNTTKNILQSVYTTVASDDSSQSSKNMRNQ